MSILCCPCSAVVTGRYHAAVEQTTPSAISSCSSAAIMMHHQYTTSEQLYISLATTIFQLKAIAGSNTSTQTHTVVHNVTCSIRV